MVSGQRVWRSPKVAERDSLGKQHAAIVLTPGALRRAGEWRVRSAAPEPILRRLFEAFRLEVAYDKVSSLVGASAVCPGSGPPAGTEPDLRRLMRLRQQLALP